MKETVLNTIIKNSFINANGWGYKIPDPSQTDIIGRKTNGISIFKTGIRPFDGVAVLYQKTIFWEAKLLKGYKSFNFNLIREHQISNLFAISRNKGTRDINIYPLIIVGIWEPHKYFDLYFFHIDYIINLQKRDKNSILKKEFMELKNKQLFLSIRKKLFDCNILTGKIINYEDK